MIYELDLNQSLGLMLMVYDSDLNHFLTILIYILFENPKIG